MATEKHSNLGDLFSGVVAGAMATGGMVMATPHIYQGITNVLTHTFSNTSVPGFVAAGITGTASFGVPILLCGAAFLKTFELVAIGSNAKRHGFNVFEENISKAPKPSAPQFGK